MRILALDLGVEMRGGQRQTLLVAAEVARRGHDLMVLCAEASPLLETLEAAGVTTSAVRRGSEATPGVLLDVARAARRFKPDVVWCSEARGHGAAVWSRIARRRPLAVHRRVVFPPKGHPLSKIKYAAVDRFLAVSAAVGAELFAAGVEPSRITIVPDGLPPESFLVVDPPKPPPLKLVHAGAFDGHKGQTVVVEVLARLAKRGWDLNAQFLGDGPARPSVERLAASLDVRALCDFPGLVSNVSERLAASHLLLLPSDSEGAPLVLVEAMAAGCAAMASDVGGARELLGGGEAGRLVKGLELDTWTDAVAELLGAPRLRAELVAAGRRLAAERTLDRTVDALLRELEGLVA